MSTILTAAFQTIQRDSAICFPMLGNLTIDPPSYFTVFGFKVYFYGVIIALGFILGIVCCTRICARFGIKEDDMYDTILVIIPTAIIGARLYYVLFELDRYLANPAEIFALRDGGLAIYGGVIACIFALWLVCRHKKIPLPAMLDVIVFGLLIGQIIGRWGNFMNREAHGSETASFLRMGLTDPDGVVRYYHPTFLYESLWNLLCFVLLHFYAKKRKFDGEIFLCYLFWYGLGRVWIEGLRTDSLYLFGTGIRVSQLLALLCVLGAGTALAVIRLRKKPDPARLYVNRKAAEAAAEAERSASSDESSQ